MQQPQITKRILLIVTMALAATGGISSFLTQETWKQHLELCTLLDPEGLAQSAEKECELASRDAERAKILVSLSLYVPVGSAHQTERLVEMVENCHCDKDYLAGVSNILASDKGISKERREFLTMLYNDIKAWRDKSKTPR